jgi:hypothetical protein
METPQQQSAAAAAAAAHGQDDGGSPPMSPASAAAAALANARWNPTKEQVAVLEGLYEHGLRTPSAEQIQQITGRLREHGAIEGKNVFYWFQNHKARQRQRQKQDSFAYFSRLLRRPPPLPVLSMPPAPPYHHGRVPAPPAMPMPMPPPPAACNDNGGARGTYIIIIVISLFVSVFSFTVSSYELASIVFHPYIDCCCCLKVLRVEWGIRIGRVAIPFRPPAGSCAGHGVHACA